MIKDVTKPSFEFYCDYQPAVINPNSHRRTRQPMTISTKCTNKIVCSSITEAEKLGWLVESNQYPKTLKTVKRVVCPDCVAKEKDVLCKSNNIYDRL